MRKPRPRGRIENQPESRKLINSRININTHILRALISAVCSRALPTQHATALPCLWDVCVRACTWEGWRMWGGRSAVGTGRGGEKQGTGGGSSDDAGGWRSAQLSVIWEVLFHFLCFFILLRRVPTQWPHPEICAWGFAYFLCPLAPERTCRSSPHEEASLCGTDQSSFPWN